MLRNGYYEELGVREYVGMPESKSCTLQCFRDHDNFFELQMPNLYRSKSSESAQLQLTMLQYLSVGL